jgi:hypothetical protein
MRKERKHFTPEEKVAILRRHLVDKVPVSELCEELGLRQNFTAVPNPPHQHLGYLTVWPFGEPQPTVSTLNNPTGTDVANAAIVPAGTGGEVAVYAYNTTDLLIDINGYFATPGTGGYSFYPAAPCRVIDTRNNNGQPFSGTLSPPVNVLGSPCAPPSTATAFVFNATVVPNQRLGYLTLWPDCQGPGCPGQPVVSTLNASDGFVTSNMAWTGRPTLMQAMDRRS